MLVVYFELLVLIQKMEKLRTKYKMLAKLKIQNTRWFSKKRVIRLKYQTLRQNILLLLIIIQLSNDSFAHALNYINTKSQVKFDEICLQQDKVAFTHKKGA